jgi:hypothetical protein
VEDERRGLRGVNMIEGLMLKYENRIMKSIMLFQKERRMDMKA